MIDPAITAASDQAHAEAEHTLNKLINWWANKRTGCNLGRSDEVAVLTYVLLASERECADLLATAVTRLADKDTP